MKVRPAIVFCDQWNARYLGCAEHPQVQTPHLNALAATGCIFDAAYTPSPVCMPARASLASGLYPHAHGFFGNYTGKLFPPENLAQSSAHADTARRLRNRLLTFLADTQLNHARGYKPLFTRIGMQFPTEDPEERKRIICDRLRQVHE